MTCWEIKVEKEACETIISLRLCGIRKQARNMDYMHAHYFIYVQLVRGGPQD